MRLAAELRDEGLRVGTYLGSSTKLAKQLKWANEQNARITVLYGPDERAAAGAPRWSGRCGLWTGTGR
ncbi:His/Gly/Thr/Pro-type tRNA ligase C-terminal domain-containing protein [Streptomyces lydicus]|uniref:His/Gly/Thr/Pro-type tRNA ligase C-terminal domain-containing protein n=1 Tax=Streptomyces lydicus TaxID=47763 RepID=UPI0038296BFE